MRYLITDGDGYLAGKLHRDPANRERVISLWSSKKADAVRFALPEAAIRTAAKIKNPALRVIPA